MWGKKKGQIFKHSPNVLKSKKTNVCLTITGEYDDIWAHMCPRLLSKNLSCFLYTCVIKCLSYFSAVSRLKYKRIDLCSA